MTKRELEERVSELEVVNAQLQKSLHEKQEAACTKQRERDSWVRRFETEKDEHRETWDKVRGLEWNNQQLEEALNQARLTIAELMTQNVRLQGRLEGALVVTGHMRLKDSGK